MAPEYPIVGYRRHRNLTQPAEPSAARPLRATLFDGIAIEPRERPAAQRAAPLFDCGRTVCSLHIQTESSAWGATYAFPEDSRAAHYLGDKSTRAPLTARRKRFDSY